MKDKIINIVQENFTDPNFDVNKLAEKLNINRSYLYRKVIRKNNCSPHRLLENKRLEKAIELLINGEKVTYVCFQAGFTTPKGLRYAMKKRLGITPKELTIKCKNNNNGTEIVKEFYLKLLNK